MHTYTYVYICIYIYMYIYIYMFVLNILSCSSSFSFGPCLSPNHFAMKFAVVLALVLAQRAAAGFEGAASSQPQSPVAAKFQERSQGDTVYKRAISVENKTPRVCI